MLCVWCMLEILAKISCSSLWVCVIFIAEAIKLLEMSIPILFHWSGENGMFFNSQWSVLPLLVGCSHYLFFWNRFWIYSKDFVLILKNPNDIYTPSQALVLTYIDTFPKHYFLTVDVYSSVCECTLSTAHFPSTAGRSSCTTPTRPYFTWNDGQDYDDKSTTCLLSESTYTENALRRNHVLITSVTDKHIRYGSHTPIIPLSKGFTN